MEHLVDLISRQIVMSNPERIKLGDQWDNNPEKYQWFNASSKLIQPIFNGKEIVEGKSIDELKRETFAAIDKKTKQIISKGFKFGEHSFSLSLEAQTSIAAINQANSLGILNDKELKWNTIDDSATVMIPTDKILDFCLTAFGAVEEAKSSGTELKEQVRAMTDFWAVAGFKDERK